MDSLLSSGGAGLDPAPWTGPFRKGLLVVFCAFAIGFSIAPLHNQWRGGSTKDYALWFNTGQLVLHGNSPYYRDRNGEFPFMYPPSASGVLAVGSVFGKLPLMTIMVIINSLAWLVCILGSIYLASGKIRGQDPMLYWVPSLCCTYYIWSTYLLGQPAMVLLACLIGMFICLRQRINWGAGALLAFAVGLKAFPILAVPYLIYRRCWKALGFTALFLLVLLFVIPMSMRGPKGAMADLHTWNSGMTMNYDPTIIGQRKERSYTWQNGSLISVANRLLRPVVADRDDRQPPIMVNLASLSFRQINVIIVICGLGMCGAYLAVMPRESRRTGWSDALEQAMLLLLIITFAPLSFTYNNVWLMPTMVAILYFILVVARTKQQRVLASVLMGIVIALLLLSIPTPPFRIPRAMGNTFWACMLFLGELGWILVLSRRSTPAIKHAEVYSAH